MALLRLALAVLLVACGSGRADGGEAEVALSGRVFSSFCGTHAGADVEVLGVPDSRVSTDAEGVFAMRGVPAHASLLATAEGFVPTISSHRAYRDGEADVELALVPTAYSELVHGLAGHTLGTRAGTIVLAVLDQSPLPVSGADVELVGLTGSVRAVERLYASLDGPLFDFHRDGGTRETGMVAFFDVPEGSYRVDIRRSGYSFPEVLVHVRGGAVTLDLIRGRGEGAALPARLLGQVRAIPSAGGDAAPLADVAVTVTTEDGEELATTSGADGTYQLALPFIRRPLDVTVSSSGYLPLRGAMACNEDINGIYDFTLADRFLEERYLGMVLGAEARDPAAGILLVQARQSGSTAGIAGATIVLDPPARSPFYTQPFGTTPRCAVAADAGQGCPSGSRSQDGECVTGETGPLCDACAASSCPTGYRPGMMARYGTTTTSCYCLPETSACDLGAPTCDPGTFCWDDAAYDGTSQSWQVSASNCHVYDPPVTTTTVSETGRPMTVYFANLPPGTYTVTGQSPSGALQRKRVRISAGVMTSVRLSPLD